MNPFEQVNSYLKRLETRLRWNAISRGAALTAIAAPYYHGGAGVHRELFCILIRQPDVRALPSVCLHCPGDRIYAGDSAAAPQPLVERRATRKKRCRSSRNDCSRWPKSGPPTIRFWSCWPRTRFEVTKHAEPATLVSSSWIFGSISAAAVAAATLDLAGLCRSGFSWATGRRCCGPARPSRERPPYLRHRR